MPPKKKVKISETVSRGDLFKDLIFQLHQGPGSWIQDIKAHGGVVIESEGILLDDLREGLE